MLGLSVSLLTLALAIILSITIASPFVSSRIHAKESVQVRSICEQNRLIEDNIWYCKLILVYTISFVGLLNVSFLIHFHAFFLSVPLTDGLGGLNKFFKLYFFMLLCFVWVKSGLINLLWLKNDLWGLMNCVDISPKVTIFLLELIFRS